MKQTRKIFVLYGEQEKVRRVMEVLDHYEATVALYGESAEINHVIACNKNAVVTSDVIPEEDLAN